MAKAAFMIMPFSDNTVRTAYKCVVKPVFDRLGFKIRKADEIWSVNPIYDDIIKEIQAASVIVVDISGKNPNVFYELGVSHTIKQEKTIILTHDEIASTPFDVAHFRIIKYSDSIESSKRLEAEIENTIRTITKDSYDEYISEFEAIFKLFTEDGNMVGTVFDLLFLDSQDGCIAKNTGYSFNVIEGMFGASSGISLNIHRGASHLLHIGYTWEDDKNYYISDKGLLFVRFMQESKSLPKCDFAIFIEANES